MIRLLRLAGFPLLLVGCVRQHAANTLALLPGSLRVDSAQYSVRVDGPLYKATIGFAFANTTGRPLSANQCHSPSPPRLEKQRPDSTWVHAYSAVELMCLTLPPFRVPAGGTYRGTLNLAAGRPGTNVFPTFGPDSVTGIYRLRWELKAGVNPDDRGAPVIAITSLPFKLILR